MQLIERISSAPYQTQALILTDGSVLTLTMYYRPLQQGWFFNSIVHEDFTLNGLRITNSPNMLNQFRNKLPFGLACFSIGNREPMLDQDFISGASKLYILSEEEVEQYAEFLRSGQI